jgi:PilZ domain
MGRERRKNFRVEWHSPATIYDSERHLDHPCILSNFSNGGAEITGVRAATIPDEFMLQITRDDGRTRKCRVVWRTDDTLGVEFTDRLTNADAPNLGKRAHEPTV